jgi:integration host factor subunit alpha
MTKADIIETNYQKVGLSKEESSRIVELVLETLKDNLENGEKVKISGFGNFVSGQNAPAGEGIPRQEARFRLLLARY